MSICVKNLTKIYKPQCASIRGLFGINKKIKAIDDVSFEINPGECVGIIGKNGSGKSTLLKLLCEITSPDKGEIRLNGRVSALLELGTGFNPEYNGISNIYLYGTVLGMKKSEIKKIIPKVAEFADIGEFIYHPVKTYSDGMFLRLAFACAVSVVPDIMIIDEALAVGDFVFRQKCFKKLSEMRDKGTTIMLVSHDIDILRRFCTRAIWLEDGKLRMDGNIFEVSGAYMESVTGNAEKSFETENSDDKTIGFANRFGSAQGCIKRIEISEVQRTDSDQTIRVYLDIPQGISFTGLALSVSVKDVYGLDLTVMSTAERGAVFDKSGKICINVKYKCRLCPGRYSACVSLEDRESVPIKYYDYIDGVAVIEVSSDEERFGVFSTDVDFEVKECRF